MGDFWTMKSTSTTRSGGKNQTYNNHYHNIGGAPDVEPDVAPGEAIYVDVMSKDGVSAFTDFSPGLFPPHVGGDDDTQTQLSSLHEEPYLPTATAMPSTDTDVHEYYVDEYNPAAEAAAAAAATPSTDPPGRTSAERGSHFVARVAEWYHQIESAALDPDGSRNGSLRSVLSSQPEEMETIPLQTPTAQTPPTANPPRSLKARFLSPSPVVSLNSASTPRHKANLSVPYGGASSTASPAQFRYPPPQSTIPMVGVERSLHAGNNNNDDDDDASYRRFRTMRRSAATISKTKVLLFRTVVICVLLLIFTIVILGVAAFFILDPLNGNNNNDNDNDSSDDGAIRSNTAPTLAPVHPSGTNPPTPGPLSVNVLQDFRSTRTGYGSSVDTAGPWIAMGSPGAVQGLVGSYRRSPNSSGDIDPNDDTPFTFLPELTGDSTNSAFGTAVAISPGRTVNDESDSSLWEQPYLLVGAPDESVNGKVYLYQIDLETTWWALQHTVESNAFGVQGEGFGTAVAMSQGGGGSGGNPLRMVVGAPLNGIQGPNAGRVYIYQLEPTVGGVGSSNSGATTVFQLNTETLVGDAANARFGTAVDITADGNTVAVGEPGRSALQVLEWDGAEWIRTFDHTVPTAVDWGTSVKFLDANHIAVGGPSADGNRGMVVVVRRGAGGIWTELPTLMGPEAGDRFGLALDGSVGPAEDDDDDNTLIPHVVVATNNGQVERFDLIADSVWVPRFTLEGETAVTAVATSSFEDSDFTLVVGYGGARMVSYWESADKMGSTVAPTPPPTFGDAGVELPPGFSQAPAPTVSPVSSGDEVVESSEARSWQQVQGPLDSEADNTLFGSTLAIAGDFLAAGQPQVANRVGDVQLFTKSSSSWSNTNEPAFSLGSRLFGSAVDMTLVDGVATMVVGAEETKDVGEIANFGAAYVFELTSQGWTQLGNTILPPAVLLLSGGRFGSAVALSSSSPLRLTVGAPNSNADQQNQDTGRIYTYEFDGSSWNQMAAPIQGPKNSLFGSAVDMSRDGSRFLVGMPGDVVGNGSVFYYQWNSNSQEWNYIFPLPGFDGEALGTSVAIVNDEGTMIAFGGPDYGDNQGRVKVYAQNGLTAPFLKRGFDFEGAVGERIGTTVCGAKGRVAFGTDTGAVRVYEYDTTSNQWTQMDGLINLGSAVTSLAMENDGETLVVGLATEEIFIYELV